MKNICASLLLLFLMSCHNNTEDAITIEICKNGIKSLDFASLAEKVDTIGLTVMEPLFVGAIKDVCYDDSFVYIADIANAVSMFDLHSGMLKKQIRNIGHGNGEYGEVTAISMDKEYLYLLDLFSKTIHKYDKNLKCVEKVKIEFPAIDFEVVDSGFLLFNLQGEECQGRFAHVDFNGSIKNTFCNTSSLPKHLVTTHYISKGSNNALCVNDALSSEIYVWEKDNPTPAPAYKLQYSNDGKEMRTVNSFSTDRYLITSFVDDVKKYYNIYDKTTETSTFGSFNINSGRPFSPMAQFHNTLAGIYSAEDLTALRQWTPAGFASCDLIMFVYHF